MKTQRQLTKRSLTVCAGVVIGLAVLAALPVLSVLAVATRAVAFAAVVALAVGAAISYTACPPLRRWLRVKIRGGIDHKGLTLADRVSLDAHHSWVTEQGGVAVIGVDDLMQAALGPVDIVEMPTPGSLVSRGETLIRLQHGQRSIEVPSPVSGVVYHRNDALQDHPEAINEDPYGRGWLVSLSSDDLSRERSGLLRGSSALRWFRTEIDRFITVLQGDEPQYAMAMADGGALIDELHRHIDDERWERVKSTFFEEPRSSSESE
jgi:glycine cleavage system H protein